MQNISSVAGLKNAIQLLEVEQAIKWQILKEQFYNTRESLKPINLIKSSLKEITSSPNLIDNILGAALGIYRHIWKFIQEATRLNFTV